MEDSIAIPDKNYSLSTKQDQICFRTAYLLADRRGVRQRRLIREIGEPLPADDAIELVVNFLLHLGEQDRDEHDAQGC